MFKFTKLKFWTIICQCLVQSTILHKKGSQNIPWNQLECADCGILNIYDAHTSVNLAHYFKVPLWFNGRDWCCHCCDCCQIDYTLPWRVASWKKEHDTSLLSCPSLAFCLAPLGMMWTKQNYLLQWRFCWPNHKNEIYCEATIIVSYSDFVLNYVIYRYEVIIFKESSRIWHMIWEYLFALFLFT